MEVRVFAEGHTGPGGGDQTEHGRPAPSAAEPWVLQQPALGQLRRRRSLPTLSFLGEHLDQTQHRGGIIAPCRCGHQQRTGRFAMAVLGQEFREGAAEASELVVTLDATRERRRVQLGEGRRERRVGTDLARELIQGPVGVLGAGSAAHDEHAEQVRPAEQRQHGAELQQRDHHRRQVVNPQVGDHVDRGQCPASEPEQVGPRDGARLDGHQLVDVLLESREPRVSAPGLRVVAADSLPEPDQGRKGIRRGSRQPRHEPLDDPVPLGQQLAEVVAEAGDLGHHPLHHPADTRLDPGTHVERIGTNGHEVHQLETDRALEPVQPQRGRRKGGHRTGLDEPELPRRVGPLDVLGSSEVFGDRAAHPRQLDQDLIIELLSIVGRVGGVGHTALRQAANHDLAPPRRTLPEPAACVEHVVVRRDLPGNHRLAESWAGVDDNLLAGAGDRVSGEHHAGELRVDHLLHHHRDPQLGRTAPGIGCPG